MLHYLTIGTLLGLSAGFAPGPLLTLVISETLQHNVRSGIKVALAPVITDVPIILLTLFLLSRLSDFHTILGMISMAGGLFVLSLAMGSFRAREITLDLKAAAPKSLIKGVLANALNPHPYLFWLSVGAPTATKAMNQGIFAAAAFFSSFYFFLVGSKVVLALVAGKSKPFLTGSIYKIIMRFLGLALCVLAIIIFLDGLELLKII